MPFLAVHGDDAVLGVDRVDKRCSGDDRREEDGKRGAGDRSLRGFTILAVWG